ncbi:tetratricopeptide repeat protein [Alteraurantiacibacter aquimixticola]|uniref:Tetratricopeptide repeat protein n=1 Tax=Alteraurantiacibacter aquimixticola TaxID=2489173 RepID=A0A4T3F7M6_9SPHN|nr:tetratricopeptide repeat protein [Alteraurantiacibacter aquimixticola]TIX50990.1 tetratricopeptide repeat protein [Alteraurantiacibacter aquimixticola]
MAILAAALTWRLVGTASEGADAAPVSTVEEAAPQSFEEMRELAEQAGGDPVPWQRLGFAHFSANMYPEAAEAYEEAVERAPDSADLWSALGEARIYADESDPMPPAALEAFRRSVALDPGNPRARYFLAVQRDLSGDNDGAIADWLALLADTPPGAPWETDLIRTISQVGQREEIDLQPRIEQAMATRDILPASATGGIPGPTQDQMAAAAGMSPGQQQDMAEDMVSRLAARLEGDPANVDGWIMLMRSYQTLGRTGQARDAYAHALEANPQAEGQLRAAAEALGL